MELIMQKRQQAATLLEQAEKLLGEGNLDGYKAALTDALTLIKAADDMEAATNELKRLKGDFNRPTNAIPVAGAETKLFDPKDNAAHLSPDYRPPLWVKGLGPAIQPTWVREKMGANLRAEAAFYDATWLKWFRARREKDFFNYASAQELKAMQENTDSEGGYFVPEEYRTIVIHNVGAPGGLHRPHCTVLTTGLKDGYMPTLGSVTWAAIAEEASYGDNTPTIGQVSFTVRKSGGMVKVSSELLEDSQANLPAMLNQIFAEAAGRYEDQQIIEGDGTTEPEGLRTTATDGVDTAANNAVTVADFLAWYYDLPAQFRANAIISTTSSFMGYLAGVGTTAAGVHLLSSLRENPDGPLVGKKVVMFDGTGWDSGAAIAADEELGCIGDFRNYYLIDRVGMTLRRDDSVYVATDQVGFFARKRFDGRIGLADAFRIFKIKT